MQHNSSGLTTMTDPTIAIGGITPAMKLKMAA